MDEKTDEEIINEIGLEASNTNLTEEEALEELTIKDDDNFDDLQPTNESPKTTETETKNDDTTKEVIENEDKDDENELSNDSSQVKEEAIPVQKKQPKIYKILIAIVTFLFLILSLGTVLFFTGFFDPEPIEPKQVEIEKKSEAKLIFDENNINKEKLNKKLTLLTKKEIMNKEELEAEEKKLKEEERKKKEAKQKALEEKKRKEEKRLAKLEEEKRLLKEQEERLIKEQKALLEMQDELKAEFEEQKKKFLMDLENQKALLEKEAEPIIEQEPVISDEKEEVMIEEKEENIIDTSKQFLSFINVATIKGDLYKTYLDKVLTIDKNVSLCRDLKNRIEIYYGPYESEKERTKIFNNLLENGFTESYLVDFTNEEYNKRCKY
ncbi:MAG: hypothetical protein OIF32_04075 [Campylobacterales bacterium]|nr:hypothetical protein [Campylobacterales bacterium]